MIDAERLADQYFSDLITDCEGDPAMIEEVIRRLMVLASIGV